MKLYKDKNGNIFAYEADGSQDHLIGDKEPITESEVNAINAQKLNDEFNALPYSKKREMFYPPITDYIDGVVKNDQAQIDKYIADCLAVKAKYPKV